MTIDRIAPTRAPQNEPVVMRQIWERILFLHWEVDPAAVQAQLPPGLTVDTFEGRAYIGLVPFTMRGVRPVWSPPVSGLSNFPEVNVRTYAHQEGRDPGVWFFSLDAANPIAVAIARALWRLPYYTAQMQVDSSPDNETINYRSTRKSEPTVGCEMEYAPNGPVTPARPDTLEFFLAERYVLYAHAHGKLYRGRVHHTPYPLQIARVRHVQDTLAARAGFPIPDTIPLMHYASGVDVHVYPLLPVKNSTGK